MEKNVEKWGMIYRKKLGIGTGRNVYVIQIKVEIYLKINNELTFMKTNKDYSYQT